ncbi:caspase family protein [Streptomyces sp. NPDC017941]|uniref:caspase, EACC1-associated type n=1 Tax=Streptomyces sp. NPDC017941 TaxID=3365018 RepID=UPI0037A1C8FD
MTTAGPSGPLSDPRASRVVLVGVHTYSHQEQLPSVARNVGALAELFQAPLTWGVPADRCTVVEQPDDPGVVLDALEDAAAVAEDTLVFYYAGHGLMDPYTEELYLSLPGSRPGRSHTALRYEYVRRIIATHSYPARRKLIILDCCWSGRALIGTMGGRSQLADQVVVEGSCLLTASSETAKALAPPDEEFTAFTGELISVVREGVAGAPEFLDMNSLYEEVRTRLVVKSRPLPQLRNRNTAGRICIARNRAHLPPAANGDGEEVRDGSRGVLAGLIREAADADVTGQTENPRAALHAFAALARKSAARLGPGHPYTLRLRQSYADWTGIAGDPGSASRLYAVIVYDCTRLLAPGHPTTEAAEDGARHWANTAFASPAAWPSRGLPSGEPADWPELPPLPASMAALLRSAHAEQSTHIEFSNACEQSLRLYWLDYEGHAQLYRVLAPGESYLQQTFVSHPWISVEAGGTIRSAFLPSAAPARVVLR